MQSNLYDLKQNSGFLEEGVQWGERESGLAREITKEETFRGGKYVHYLDFDDGFRSIYMC